MTECAIVEDVAGIEALAADWRRLAGGHPRPTVFLSHAWALVAAREGAAPRVVVAREGGAVTGLLALREEDQRLRFLGAPYSDYNDLLCAPGADRAGTLAAALDALDRRPFRACLFENVWQDALLLEAIPALPERFRSRVQAVPSGPCPRVVVPESDPAYFQGLVRKDSLKRPDNKLQKTGTVTFRHLEDRDEIVAHLPAFYEQHRGRRELAGDRSLFHDERARAFFRALVETLDPKGPLRFALLERDGKPLAYHFGFEEGGTFVWYKPTFDPALAELSPGTVLLRRLFQYSGERKLRVFDFTIGDEEFKRRHATDVLTAHAVHFRPGGARGRLGHAALAFKERLKRHPRLFAALKRLAGRG